MGRRLDWDRVRREKSVLYHGSINVEADGWAPEPVSERTIQQLRNNARDKKQNAINDASVICFNISGTGVLFKLPSGTETIINKVSYITRDFPLVLHNRLLKVAFNEDKSRPTTFDNERFIKVLRRVADLVEISWSKKHLRYIYRVKKRFIKNSSLQSG